MESIELTAVCARPAALDEALLRGDVVLTRGGAPIAVVVAANADTLAETQATLRVVRLQRAIARVRSQARERGLEPSDVEIEEEIRAVRKARRSLNDGESSPGGRC